MEYIVLIALIVCLTLYGVAEEYFKYKKEKERNKNNVKNKR